MKKFLSITIISLLSISGTLQAQQDSTHVIKENIFRRVNNDARLTAHTILKTYAQPLKWKKRDWLRLGGALAISGAVMFVDEPIADFFNENRSRTKDRLADVGDFLGQPEHNYPFMLLLWSSGVVSKNEWLRDTGIMLFASVTTSGILQTIGKDVVGRARPSDGDDAFNFRPFGGAAHHSFPSGHTMLALATSWILARQVKPVPLKVFFYSLPVLVGWSRVYDQAHWVSDVLLGSALGIACAEAVVRIYPKLKDKLREQQGLSLLPTGRGLSLTYRF